MVPVSLSQYTYLISTVRKCFKPGSRLAQIFHPSSPLHFPLCYQSCELVSPLSLPATQLDHETL